MANTRQKLAAEVVVKPARGRILYTVTAPGIKFQIRSGGKVVVEKGEVEVCDSTGRKLAEVLSDSLVTETKSANDNTAQPPQAVPEPKTVKVLAGTPEEWKAAVKAKVVAGEINVRDAVTGLNGTDTAWVLVSHPKRGKDFFVAEKDYTDASDKEHFTHYEALDIAKNAGAQLMNLTTGMLSYKAFKAGILKNFKTDTSYWLSDLCFTLGARTQWYDDGTQGYDDRNTNSRLRLALEI